MKIIITNKMQDILNKQIESIAVKEAMKKEVEIIYKSLVSLAKHGLHEINTPIGTWEFTKDDDNYDAWQEVRRAEQDWENNQK